jgi:hypothetical protein
MVQIYNLMKLLIFRWFYHHHWMVQHMTFMTFFLLNLLKSQGALYDPQDPQGPSNDTPRTSQGPPKDLPGTPTDLPRTPKAGNRMKFYVDLIDCHQVISKILFV